MVRLRFIALGAMLCVASVVMASPFTSNGTGGGNWNTSATWGGVGVPGAGDTVTISGGDVVFVTDPQSALTILIDTASTLRVDSTGTLTVGGTGTAVTINAPVVALSSRIQLFGGTMTVSNGGIAVNGDPSGFAKIEYDSSGGTLGIKTDLSFSGSNTQLTFTTGGNLNIGGNLGSSAVFSAGNSTVLFNGTGSQTIGGPYTFYNLSVGKATGTATLAAPTNVFGNLTVSSGILDDGGQQITLNSGFSSNVNIGGTGVLKLGSAASATTFPANHNPANTFFSPNSVVDYHAGVSQTINTSFTYRRLFVATTGGSVAHSFSGTLTVAEDVTVNDNGPSITTLNVGGATLDVNTNISGDGTVNVNGGSISLGGNWAATSSLVAGAGSTVTYDGIGSQSVLAAAYHHLVINKTAGTATFAGTTSAAGNFTVTAGTVDLGTQTVTVTGTLTNNGTLGFNTATVILLGNLTNNTSIFSSTATLKMNGTAAQAINSPVNAINLAAFEVNNGAGVSVTTNMGVLTTLKLFGGNVTVNAANFVYVDVNCAVTKTSGWFVGPLRMGFSPVTPRRMEIGTAAVYMPIDIDAGSGGDIQARAVEGLHANRTGNRTLSRYWRIESPSSVLPIDVLTFNYNLTDINSGSEFEFMLGHYNGASWLREGDVVNEGAHTATLLNVSDYIDDDWMVGHGGSMGGAGKLKITQINGGTNPTVNVPFDVDVETWTDDDSSTGDVFANTSVDILLQTGGGSLLGATDFIAPGTHAVTISGNTYDTAETGVQLRADGSSGDAVDDGLSANFTVSAAPSTLTVTSINDNGPGTLRDAIETVEANGCAVPCTINFTTSGNIVLLTPLPTLARGDVTIDGYSAPGGAAPNTNAFGLPSNAVITVSLDGVNGIGTGFDIFSQNVVIKGFAIKNFNSGGGRAVKFTGSNTGSAVTGCFIGTDTTGLVAAPNENGVYFLASNDGVAGGPNPADRNVISGNTIYGVYAGAGSNNIQVYGSYIGVKADLSGALPNNGDGVWISSSSNAVIGDDTVLGNLISGNAQAGIDMDGFATIEGNLIGTNGTGTAAIANNVGIELDGSGTTIGGPAAGERNVISGNSTHGIHITGDGNDVDNNYIGVGSDGTTSIPNGGNGVRLSGNAADDDVGTNVGNVIAHNVLRGISVATSPTGIGNGFRKNVIHSNGLLAIDLGEDGPTLNDATDADNGANDLQNFPTISSANISGPNVQLTVSVDSSGSVQSTDDFTIDVYKSSSSSPTPALEWLGDSGCIAGPTLNNYTFTVPAGSAVSGDRIVVTATSYENVGIARGVATHSGCLSGATDGTSELSATATLSGDIHWNNASGGAWEVAANWNPAVVPGVNDVAFIDLGGTYTVTVNSPITVDKVHVGTGISGVQTLNIIGGTSLTINNPSDVTTTGNLTVNGTLTGIGTLDVNGTLDWNAGTISGVAALNITTVGTLNLATGGTKTLSQRLLTISNGGAANWTGGSFALQTGGGVVNLGTFDIKTDNSLVDNGADAGFQNSGTLRKSVTGGTTTFSAVDLFHNAGTIDVQTGILDLEGGTAAAPIAISSGAEVLINSSLFTFNGGTSVSGAGKVQTASLGILNVDGPLVTIEHLYVNGGTVGGSGIATTGPTGTWQWDQGTMSGPGTSRIASGGSMNIPGANPKNLGRTLDIVSGGTVNLGGTGALNLQPGGNIANAGTFDIIGDASIVNAGGGAIANSGTFKRSISSGTATLNGVALNHTAGTINLLTGTLDMAGGSSSAAISIAGGATFLVNSDTYTFALGTTVSGAGGVDVTSGTLTVSGNVTIPKLTLSGGTIDGAGVLTIGTTGAWSFGTMQGNGVTEVANGATLTLSTGSVKNLNTRALSIVNGGTVDWTAGTLALNTGANINNAGLFHAQFDGSITNGGTAGTFTNNGTLRKSGTTGFTNFFLPLTNVAGTVDIQNGIVAAGAGYSQGAAGVLKLHLAGTTAGSGYGQLNTASNPSLGGALQVVLVNPFDPAGGNTFRAVAIPGGTHTGDFVHPYTLPALSAGRTWTDAYDASGLLLSVIGSADLSIAKTAPSSNVAVSAPIAYTITVTNTSTDAANSVVVTDTLPAGHTGISASGTGWNCNVVSSTVTCTATAPLPNGAAPAITINATAPNTPQTFTNIANVTSSNDPNNANDSASFIVTVNPNTVDLDLSSLSPPAPLPPSTPFTFDFTITNHGPQTATSVVFTAPIPPGITYNSATPDTGSCNFASNTVTCNIGSIASTSNKHVILGLTTGSTPGTHTVIGSGASVETDSVPSNNTIPTPVSVIGNPLVVVNTNDSGSGSLRQALADAQVFGLCPAPCTIAFNIPVGPFIIQPMSDLPLVAPSVIVDGTTQPGYSGTPIIQVDGALNSGSALLILGNTNAKVKGLSLTGALKGVFISGSGNSVEACSIGVNPAGAPAPNVYGVAASGNNNNIGATTAGAGNTIAHNSGNGVTITGTGVGNFIIDNRIFGNGGLGIDLGDDGATPNDAGDGDAPFANNRQNSPNLTGVFLNGGGDIHVTYDIDSSAAANVASISIQLFEADSVAGGQGKLPRVSVCHNGSDNFAAGLDFNEPSYVAGTPFVMTATSYSNANCTTVSDGTSEFSNVVVATTCVPPAATINAPPNVCPSSTGNAAGVNAPTATSFTWTVGGGGTLLTGQGTANITFSAPASGTVTLSVAVTNAAGCPNTAVANVPVVAPAPVTITAPPAVCASSTNNHASVPAGASSYVWTITGGAITAGQGTSNLTFSANASGSVQLGITVTNGSCTSTGSVTFPINPPPTVTITGPTTACPFTTFTLDAGVFSTYQWSDGSTGRFLAVSQSAPSAVYSVIVTNGSGCSAGDTHTVTLTSVDATISAPANVPPSTGGHVASVPAQPGASYAWSIGNGSITSGAGTNSITFTAGASGNVSLSVTVSLSGCSSTGFASVPIDSPPADPCALRGVPLLLAPANAAVLASSSVDFSWIPSPTATASRVWLSLDGAPPVMLGQVSGNTLTANVAPGHAAWFVEDLFAACPPSQSGQRTFTIPAADECGTTPPVIITPVNHSSAGTWSAISWTGVAHALAYEVWMAFEDGPYVRVGTTADTSLEISPWSAGTYDFFVRALADLCDPVDSAVVRFTYAPSAACAENQRTILISPLDADITTSPASFSWSPRPGSTRHELYVVRENGAPVRAGSTTGAALSVQLASGPMRWFVRSFFGPDCSPLDSERQDLTIVNPPAACSPLTPPVISAPGEISAGVEFLVQWTSDQAATGYELQVASNGTFAGAEVITTNATSHALTRGSGIVFARVRSIDNRCAPASVSAFGPTAAIFILPPNAEIGTVPLNAPNVAHYTIALGPEFAGQIFTAVPSEEWLSVVPASGIVAPAGTTLAVTADSEGLGLGANTGAIHITLNTASAGSIATHATTVIIPSISVNVVTPVKPAASNPPSADTMIIPGVANADGINSHFQSDVRVANTSPQLIKYQLTFIPSGEAGLSASRQTTFSIEPGRTVALDDVLKSWFGTGTQNAIGVLEIRPLTQIVSSPTAPPVGALANLLSFASSRTFNVTANGTFGQYIPAIPFANFIDKSKIISLQQISQSSKYRSNLALFEASGQPASVLIKVFGANGQQITQFAQNLAGGQHTQLNSFLLSRGITLDDGRVEVSVTSTTGKVTAVASVLDNQTSDAITVVPVTLEESGNTKWVIPGVADIRSGFANWQSDVRIFNANTTATDVTATFYSQAGGEPKVQTIHMNPGEVKQYDKALASLFGIAADGGALHLSTAQPSRIIATARTYNDTPTGTYGQFISAVTPGEAVGVGSRPLQILQVEESARMRSNVAFAEVTGKPVKLEVTVTPPDAKFSASIEVDLAANEFRQIGSILASTLGLSDTYNARISVRALSGEGRALACASVIDLKTNDPTLIQAQ